MYKFLAAQRLIEARIKGADEYDFFTYQGKTPVEFDYRGKAIMLKKGDKFGVRPSSSGKEIRLVKGDELTKVVTITYEQAKSLARRI